MTRYLPTLKNSSPAWRNIALFLRGRFGSGVFFIPGAVAAAQCSSPVSLLSYRTSFSAPARSTRSRREGLKQAQSPPSLPLFPDCPEKRIG